MAYNYSKLNGRIVEIFKTRKSFATAMGLTESGLSNRLTGKTPFTQSEIVKAVDLLSIKSTEIMDYFFRLEVQLK